MSDIHVQTINSNGIATLIFHYPVPDTNNDVAVNHRIALVNGGKGGITAMTIGVGAGQIAQAEADLIAAGAVYEENISYPIASGGTGAVEMRAALRAMYTSKKAAALTRLATSLQFFGHTESEV